MRNTGIGDGILEMSRDRREFMKRAVCCAAGLLCTPPSTAGAAGIPDESTVSFVTGADRRQMMLDVLEPLRDEIAEGIRGRQVVIKANLVGPDPLCAAHADAVRGVLDFLTPICRNKIVVGDSTGRTYPGPMGTWKHFELHGYLDLPKEYNCQLLDLNDRPTRTLWIVERGPRPRPVNIIDTFLDPGVYLISLCRLKTHSDVVATLSVKNTVMGSPVSHYRQRSAEGRNEKSFMHSGGIKNINFNIFLVAQQVMPSLSVIDGLVGMEGNGPTKGTAVEHGIALAGTDAVAVDTVGMTCMGIDTRDVGYLSYCADAGLGRGDLSNIRVPGHDPRDHVIPYRLHDNIEKQMTWKEGLAIDR